MEESKIAYANGPDTRLGIDFKTDEFACTSVAWSNRRSSVRMEVMKTAQIVLYSVLSIPTYLRYTKLPSIQALNYRCWDGSASALFQRLRIHS